MLHQTVLLRGGHQPLILLTNSQFRDSNNSEKLILHQGRPQNVFIDIQIAISKVWIT